jgi:hypothetical protein
MSEAKFEPAASGSKPVEVRTMADIRQAVWRITGQHTGVSVDDGRVFQGGQLVGRLRGEVSGQ